MAIVEADVTKAIFLDEAAKPKVRAFVMNGIPST